MNDVEQFLPEERASLPLAQVCPDSFFTQPAGASCGTLEVGFLVELGKRLMTAKDARAMPEVVALAFWLRRATLEQLVASFARTLVAGERAVPRGTAFHIAPNNVDTIFVYSWALSLLAGNRNVVRISQQVAPAMRLMLDVMGTLLREDAWREIAERNRVLTYAHDDYITGFFSARADVRIVWGGDDTVRKIRSFPSKPRTHDLVFVDKVSFAVLGIDALLKASDETLAKLAHAFYNDAYWFDQMACSSPQTVFLVGARERRNDAASRFWRALDAELAKRQHIDSMAVAMNKLVLASDLGAACAVEPFHELPVASHSTVARFSDKERLARARTCGGGFFFEAHVDAVADLAPWVEESHQTLAYWGINVYEAEALLDRVRGLGIDRVVPVGRALEFSATWDGYALLNELTRRITVQPEAL